MRPLLLLLLLVTGTALGVAPAAGAQPAPGPTVVRTLAGGHLRVVSLYKAQAALLRTRDRRPDAETVDALVAQVYTPHAGFWAGYLGDEARFRTLAAMMVSKADLVLPRLDSAERVPLDSLFRAAAGWVVRHTGLQPRGTWYLVFAHGATDMGSVGDAMVADFNAQPPSVEALGTILPHELTHMVYGRGPTRARDPDRGTVLDRIVSEGVASYASFRARGGRSEAQALLADDGEWRAGLAHEHEMLAAVRPLLSSRDPAALDSVASRQKRLVPGGPTAAGYFLGFRLAAAYEAAHGPGSWKEILTRRLRDVVARSGYPLGELPG